MEQEKQPLFLCSQECCSPHLAESKSLGRLKLIKFDQRSVFALNMTPFMMTLLSKNIFNCLQPLEESVGKKWKRMSTSSFEMWTSKRSEMSTLRTFLEVRKEGFLWQWLFQASLRSFYWMNPPLAWTLLPEGIFGRCWKAIEAAEWFCWQLISWMKLTIWEIELPSWLEENWSPWVQTSIWRINLESAIIFPLSRRTYQSQTTPSSPLCRNTSPRQQSFRQCLRSWLYSSPWTKWNSFLKCSAK